MRKILQALVLTIVATQFALIASAAESETLHDVRSRGSLRIAIEGTYPPFSFIDDTGNLTGFEVEFGNSLAEHLGVKPDFVLTKWAGLLASIQVERADVAINMVSATEERKKIYEFSTPYLYSGMQFVVHNEKRNSISSVADLSGKRVGVGMGSIHEKWLREHNDKIDVRVYEDDASRNQDLLADRLDAILNDHLITTTLVTNYPGQMHPVGPIFETQEKAVVAKKGRTQFIAEIDNALQAMRADRSLEKISVKWFRSDMTHP